MACRVASLDNSWREANRAKVNGDAGVSRGTLGCPVPIWVSRSNAYTMTVEARPRTEAVAKQLEMLRRMDASRAVISLPWIFVATAAALCVVAWHYAEPGFALFAAFAVLLATVVRTAIPFMRLAIQALDSSLPVHAKIQINALPNYDSPHFEAVVSIDPHTAWRITFPQTDWKPVAGSDIAEIYYLPGVPWPSLLITPTGTIWPRSKPQRISRGRPSLSSGEACSTGPDCERPDPDY